MPQRKRKRVLNPFIEEEAAVDESDEEEDYDEDDLMAGEGGLTCTYFCQYS